MVCQEDFFTALTGETGPSDPGLNREQVLPVKDNGVVIHPNYYLTTEN